tara:strand:+ start:1829 stop:2335 length:507 start_codon:yes stop_codon:yes gene_type:complete
MKFIVVLLLLIMISCTEIGSNYKHNFKDQELQGKIGGKEWVSKNGKASLTQRDSTTTWSFQFSDLRDENAPCSFSSYDIGKVMFSTKNIDPGVKKLKMSFNLSKAQTITMVYDQDSAKGPMNKIALEGAFEITEFDTVNKNIIKGRMDIYSDDDNFVNGNFEATFCKN